MAVDALPSHDSLASLTLPLSPSPLEIKSCERHIELAVRRRPIRQRAVVRPSRRIGRWCIECGASALSIARNLTTIRSLERAHPLPLPLPHPHPHRVVRFSRAEEREQLPRTRKLSPEEEGRRRGRGRGRGRIRSIDGRRGN